MAETIPGRVWWWESTEPGQVRIERTGTANRGHLLVGVPGYQEFDSLAVDSAGYVCVATLHNGGDYRDFPRWPSRGSSALNRGEAHL